MQMPSFEKLPAVRKNIDDSFAHIRDIIRRIKFDKFPGFRLSDYPNVIDIRPGYKVTGEKLLDTKAIVFVVRKKMADESLKPTEQIPKYIEGEITDIAPVNAYEVLRMEHVTELAGMPPGSTPVNTDWLLDSDRYNFSLLKAPETIIPKIGYVPPADVLLEEVKEAMTVICHVSPEQGWNQLKPFLDQVSEKFTLGMYDFSAPWVKNALVDLAGRAVPFDLVYDGKPPAGAGKDGNKKDDLSEDTIIDDISQNATASFQHVKAALNSGGLFANAYHIKVGVDNNTTFWLSSGNMQSSNQPDLQELGHPSQSSLLAEYNREWHIICKNKKLATIYNAFLEYDLQQSKIIDNQRNEQGIVASPMKKTFDFSEIELVQENLREISSETPFQPKVIERTAANPLRIQPLLTPDNYIEKVLPLIQGASNRLYFQNQYIKPAKTMTDQFIDLLDALRDKTNDPNIDCRIILRNEPDARLMLENLKALDFDMSKIRIQNNCHNKGIVIDNDILIVGSHNYSNSGVQFNRDASLIFYDQEVNAYFASVFTHDWDQLAVARVPENSTHGTSGDTEGVAAGYATKHIVALESMID